jgi:hypothetical protein
MTQGSGDTLYVISNEVRNLSLTITRFGKISRGARDDNQDVDARGVYVPSC